MVVELPMVIEEALRAQASALGVSAEAYLFEVLERELRQAIPARGGRKPLKSAYGMLAKYGPAPSAEEIDENRREMFGISPKPAVGSSLTMDDDNEPFETGRGVLAKYGPAPSAEEIAANRADMFRGFGEKF